MTTRDNRHILVVGIAESLDNDHPGVSVRRERAPSPYPGRTPCPHCPRITMLEVGSQRGDCFDECAVDGIFNQFAHGWRFHESRFWVAAPGLMAGGLLVVVG